MTQKKRWLYHFLVKAGMERLPSFIYLSPLTGWMISLGCYSSHITNKVLGHLPRWRSGSLGKTAGWKIEKCQHVNLESYTGTFCLAWRTLSSYRIRVILVTISVSVRSCDLRVLNYSVMLFTALKAGFPEILFLKLSMAVVRMLKKPTLLLKRVVWYHQWSNHTLFSLVLDRISKFCPQPTP